MSQAPDLSWHLRKRMGWTEWIADLDGQALRVTQRGRKCVGMLEGVPLVKGYDCDRVKRQLVLLVLERMGAT